MKAKDRRMVLDLHTKSGSKKPGSQLIKIPDPVPTDYPDPDPKLCYLRNVEM